MLEKGIKPWLLYILPHVAGKQAGFEHPRSSPVSSLCTLLLETWDLVRVHNINEPNVYTSTDALRNMAACKDKVVLKVKLMALCHVLAYQLIHEIRKEKLAK